jgi:hypothetical protein
VSVVIPAYNAEAYLAEAVASALAQTHVPLEVLVVDDGSTDGTARCVQAFGPPVRCVGQANAGPSAARNRGVAASRGEVVAFLDADDRWLPGTLAAQVAALGARPVPDVVFGWARFVDASGAALAEGVHPTVADLEPSRLLLAGSPLLLSTMAARRDLLVRLGPFDPALQQGEDWDLALRLVAGGARFAAVPAVLTLRRVHAASLTTDVEGALAAELQVLERAARLPALAARVARLRPAATFRIYQRAAMGHWRAGRTTEAVGRLADAFAQWPQALGRPQTYVGLLVRLLPSGRRSEADVLPRVEQLAVEVTRLLEQLFAAPHLPARMRARRRLAYSALHAALALLTLRGGRPAHAAGHAVRALYLHPQPPLLGAAAAATRSVRRTRLARLDPGEVRS